MQEIDDLLLLDRFRNGDQQAFETLFTRHYTRVYRAAYGIARAHESAEDLAQEAFLVLYRRPPLLANEIPLVAWLCRVALNRASNLLRGERREAARLALVGVEPVADPIAELERLEEQSQVRLVLAGLPERQAHLLVLRTAGLRYNEIAAALDIAPGSVGTLLVRAERAFLAAYTALDATAEYRV